MEDSKKKTKNWPKASVSGLEADIAYFDARLSMLEGEIPTTHKKAQSRAYQALESALIGMLLKLRMQSGKAAKSDLPKIDEIED